MSTMLAPTPVRSNSSVLAYLGPAVVLVLTALLYWQVVASLANDWWTQPNLSQGLLIPPLAAWIAWIRRDQTTGIPIRPDSRGLGIIALACLLYIFGIVAAEFFLSRMSLIVLIAGLICTFWGAARLRSLTFPIVLLATAIPLPTLVYNSVAAPLQLLASEMASGIAQMLGVTVYRDGNVINLAHMSLGVEEACSGLNSLSAMMVASVLLGFLLCRKPVSRWLLFALSIPVAIAANIVRVTGTAVLADFNEAFAKGFYHALSGWLVFLVGFAGLYGLAQLFSLGERRLSRSRS